FALRIGARGVTDQPLVLGQLIIESQGVVPAKRGVRLPGSRLRDLWLGGGHPRLLMSRPDARVLYGAWADVRASGKSKAGSRILWQMSFEPRSHRGASRLGEIGQGENFPGWQFSVAAHVIRTRETIEQINVAGLIAIGNGHALIESPDGE